MALCLIVAAGAQAQAQDRVIRFGVVGDYPPFAMRGPDDATLTEPLLAGQVDVWITDGVVVDLMARRYPGQLCATTLEPFTHVTKAWLVRRDPVVFADIQSRLRAAVSSGAWQAAVEAIH